MALTNIQETIKITRTSSEAKELSSHHNQKISWYNKAET